MSIKGMIYNGNQIFISVSSHQSYSISIYYVLVKYMPCMAAIEAMHALQCVDGMDYEVKAYGSRSYNTRFKYHPVLEWR